MKLVTTAGSARGGQPRHRDSTGSRGRYTLSGSVGEGRLVVRLEGGLLPAFEADAKGDGGVLAGAEVQAAGGGRLARIGSVVGCGVGGSIGGGSSLALGAHAIMGSGVG